MKTFWFRICFEKDFEDENEARDFEENLTDEFYDGTIKELHCEVEDRTVDEEKTHK